MNARESTIRSSLRSRVRKSVTVFYLISAIISSTLIILQYENESRNIVKLILEQSLKSAESAVLNQDILLIQKNLERSFVAFPESFPSRLGVEVFLNGELFGRTGSYNVDQELHSIHSEEKKLSNGQTLRVVVGRAYFPILIKWLVAQFSIAIFMLILGFLFERMITKSLDNVLSPLATAIEELNQVSSKLDQIEIFDLNANKYGGYVETRALGDSINRLVNGLKHYKSALADSQTALVEVERRNSANQALTSMTPMLAHDVRRPLASLAATLGVMKRLSSDPDALVKFFDMASKSVEKSMIHVNGLIADVMEMGNDKPLQLQETELQPLLTESINLVFSLHDKPIQMTSNIQHTYSVQGDSGKLIRAFANIIDNAMQAVNRGGQLWIKTRDVTWNELRSVEVTIGNSGSLIPPEELTRIFESFYTKGKKGGTGLGLAIVDKVIKAHRGEVTCRSSETKGTEFIVTLRALE